MGILNYLLGPKLYMEYGDDANQKMYEPNGLEKFGDQILSTLSWIWNFSYYTSPLIVTFLYRRGFLAMDAVPTLAKFTASVGAIAILSLCLRGFGRAQSRSYGKLIKAVELSKSAATAEQGKRELRKFDFEFKAWQVDFDVASVSGEDDKKPVAPADKTNGRFRLATLPCDLVAYIAIHTFGIMLIYPGSVKLLQSFMRPMIVEGRSKLIQKDKGQRYKVKTIDQNEIDTMFVDNRINKSNGNTLVICSEGNAGFYEIGIMQTPLMLKYSVLGWNHPGFEGSSGTPYPNQDKNAIDAVVQFAIHKLGFAVEDIILYGWSIGGYSTLVAASMYPEVKGVILDATFDDVLYLALPRMPAALSSIVKLAIREHCNLNNAALLPEYNGPILIIRRTEDEIIADDLHIDTNRGNYLLLALLKYRYPNIFKVPQLNRIKGILSKPLPAKSNVSLNEDLSKVRLMAYASDVGKTFPMQIGEDYTDAVRNQMADFLLYQHFRDYKSTHCTPLPTEYFNIPWDIPTEQGFVFT